MINAEGGVNGRKLYLKYNVDDAGSTTNDEDQARNLVESDHVFAVVGVGTPFFTGSQFLAQEGTPTFGYVVTQDWNNSPNLFGAYGSYLDYSTEAPTAAFLARALGSKSVAVVAYNFGPSSAPCQDVVNGLVHFGVHVGFEDLNFDVGSPTSDVQQMASHHVDLLFSCMEGSDTLAFERAMHQYGSTTHAIWLSGYSRSVVAANPTLTNGVIFAVQHVPFEAATQFPGMYPGMEQYISTMEKYEPQWVYDDTAIQPGLDQRRPVRGRPESDRPQRHPDPAHRRNQPRDELQRGRARTPSQLDQRPHFCTPSILRGVRRGNERLDQGRIQRGKQRLRMCRDEQRPSCGVTGKHARGVTRALKEAT